MMSQRVLISIFDRLFQPRADTGNCPIAGTAQVAESVHRDLEILLNTHKPKTPENRSTVATSIMGYGVDYLSPQQLATEDGQRKLAQQLVTAIARYEPRLHNVTVTASGVWSHQRLRFRIEASLWVNTRCEHISFESALEPVTGTVSLMKAAS